ncbi:GspH/FimT family pseudopilin [Halomonas sp.]|uniref:GspH/FimT family pseudopilin n=1 Tax=Halomonas sp. TaxID=1486246 RepID=UPI003850A129
MATMIVGKVSSRRGFTLIELIVTIAVAAILAALAAPSYQRFIASNRLSSDYNEVLSGLNFARSEAIKRREAIEFTLEQGAAPWSYYIIRAADDYSVSPASALRVRESGNNSVSIVFGDGSVVFNSLGKSDCSSGCEIEVAESTQGGCRVITVSSFGRVGRGDECAEES